VLSLLCAEGHTSKIKTAKRIQVKTKNIEGQGSVIRYLICAKATATAPTASSSSRQQQVASSSRKPPQQTPPPHRSRAAQPTRAHTRRGRRGSAAAAASRRSRRPIRTGRGRRSRHAPTPVEGAAAPQPQPQLLLQTRPPVESGRPGGQQQLPAGVDPQDGLALSQSSTAAAKQQQTSSWLFPRKLPP